MWSINMQYNRSPSPTMPRTSNLFITSQRVGAPPADEISSWVLMREVLFWAMADRANCGAQERRSQRLITAHLPSLSSAHFHWFFFKCHFFNYRSLLVLSGFPSFHVWGLPLWNFYPELIAVPGRGQISGCVVILSSLIFTPAAAHACVRFSEVTFKSWLYFIEDAKSTCQVGTCTSLPQRPVPFCTEAPNFLKL